MEVLITYSHVTIQARRALLDALIALRAHRNALVLVGAQAVYLYTGDTDVQIATTTKDSAVIPDLLGPDPVIEAAMRGAGFHHDLEGRQGLWLTPDGVPVELLVPDGMQPGKTRGARIPPHDNRVARRVPGIEAAAVDHRPMTIQALDLQDDRREEVNVAGPAALVVAKTHKIADRVAEVQAGRKDRLVDKDAHDVYRLLRKVDTPEVVAGLRLLLSRNISQSQAQRALEALEVLAADPAATMCVMAGRAEALVGDPEEASASTWALVQDVLDGLR